MRVAVIVLAVLGIVFGFIGALAAFALTDAASGLTGGVLGTQARNNSLWSLGAVVLSVVALALIGRSPRLTAVGLLASAVIGVLGSSFFVVATLLLGIAGLLAFFVPASLAQAAASSAEGAVTSTGATMRMPIPRAPSLERVRAARPVILGPVRLPWPLAAALAAAVIVVAGVLTAGLVSDASEQKPVTALFAAVSSYDTPALAALVPPDARSGSTDAAASRVLSTALGGSEISFLANDLFGKLGKTSGAAISFEKLSVSTVSKKDDTATVRATGILVPSHPNALINAGFQLLRTGFTTTISMRRVGSTWYVDMPPVVAQPGSVSATRSAEGLPATSATPTPVPVTPTRAPMPVPTIAPTPTRAPVALATPMTARYVADFKDPAGSGLPPATEFARYQGGGALMSGCRNVNFCWWTVRPSSPFTAVEAFAETQGGVNWAVALRVTEDARNAVLAGLQSDGTCWMVTRINGGWQNDMMVTKDCRDLHRTAGDRIGLAVRGAKIVMSLNGSEVLSAFDSQTDLGNGFGIAVAGGGTVFVTDFRGQ